MERIIGKTCHYRSLFTKDTKTGVVTSFKEFENAAGKILILVTLENGDIESLDSLFFEAGTFERDTQLPDQLKGFYTTCCEFIDGAETAYKEVYDKYNSFCKERGFTVWSKRGFFKQFQSRSGVSLINRNGVVVLTGLKLK